MKRFILSAFMLFALVQISFSQSTTTSPAIIVSGTEVNLQGNINTGGAYCYSVVFEYADNPALTGATSVIPDQGNSFNTSQNITKTIDGLTAGTQYWYKLKVGYSVANGGPMEGALVSFTTTAATSPTVTTNATANNIEPTTASLDGNVVSMNGAAVTEKGVCWGTSTEPLASSSNKYTNGQNGVGLIIGNITGLTAATTYYARSYAINSAGTSYGDERIFKTKPHAPTSAAATDIEGTSFTANWSVPSGGNQIDYYLLEIDTDPGFGSSTTHNVGNVTSYNVTSGISENTTYHYRVYAYNDGGTDGAPNTSDESGSQTFTTISTEPSTQAVIDSMVSQGQGELTIYFTAGQGGSGQMIFGRENLQNANTPVDGNNSYVANTVFGNGSNLGNNSYVVYYGSGAKGSVTVTGLDESKDYYFSITEFNGSGTNINYNTVIDQSGTDNTNFPIELLSFGATVEANNVYIKWATATEKDNDYFLIERSFDGINFETVDKVNGAGTTSEVQHYQVVDLAIEAELVYYRLRQFDFNGAESTFPAIKVNMENANSMEIGNAIVKESSLHLIVKNGDQDATLHLIDMNGKVVYETTLTFEGQQMIQVPMDQLAKGIYLLRMHNNSQESVEKKVIF